MAERCALAGRALCREAAPSGGRACIGGVWSASPPAEGARHTPPQAVLLGAGLGGVWVALRLLAWHGHPRPG